MSAEISGWLENLVVIWQYIKDEISDRVSSGQKREDEPRLGEVPVRFAPVPRKKSTIFFTLPSKIHQPCLFPLDTTVEQGCIENRISLGLEFMTNRVLGMDLLWCQGRQYWVVHQKDSIRIQVQGQEETQTENLLQRWLSQGIFFHACEKEVWVPLGNRAYMRQAEKLKTTAYKCSVVLQCKEFCKALGKWFTCGEPRSANWVMVGNHKNVGSCRLERTFEGLPHLIRTELTSLRQAPQSFWVFPVMDISHSLQENFHYLITNRINFVR